MCSKTLKLLRRRNVNEKKKNEKRKMTFTLTYNTVIYLSTKHFLFYFESVNNKMWCHKTRKHSINNWVIVTPSDGHV